MDWKNTISSSVDKEVDYHETEITSNQVNSVFDNVQVKMINGLVC